MAVDQAAIDGAKRCLFYRINRYGVPVELPYHLITIDGTQYYEPLPNCRIAEDGSRLKGVAAEVVYLDRNEALPVQRGLRQTAVWQYNGI